MLQIFVPLIGVNYSEAIVSLGQVSKYYPCSALTVTPHTSWCNITRHLSLLRHFICACVPFTYPTFLYDSYRYYRAAVLRLRYI